MTDFLEKLKKGMDTESIPEVEETEEPVAEFTSSPVDVPEEPEEKEIKKPKKAKKTKKKVEEEAQKIEVQEEEKPSIKKEDSLFEGPEGELTIDVYQSGKNLIVRSAIAGVEPEDLDITIENDLIVIKGDRKKVFAEEKEDYFFQECYWGRFKREIILPVEVDSSRADAKLENGILVIKIPIIEERKKKKKISIR